MQGVMEHLRCCRGAFSMSFVALLLVRLVAVSAAQVDGTVIFVESGRQQFLRTGPSSSEAETLVFSYADVGASVAVLLGVVPQAPVNKLTSSKLDSVVSPNPFQRPRAVLSLNIGGVDSDLLSKQETLGMLGIKSYQHRSLMTEDSYSCQFSGDDVKLTKFESVDKDAKVSEQEVNDMECLLGGSCKSDGDQEIMTGIVSWDVNKDETITFDLSESADHAFVKELVVLFGNIKRAVASSQAVDQDFERPADLYFGTFNGIKELRKQYGSGPRTELASKFVLHAVAKALQFLQANYNDELVGVFTFLKTTAEDDSFKLTVTERSARILQASVPAPGNETYPEQQALQLADKAIVFFTVIILIVSLLLSTCCLFTMPVTRDSLLYSGVKLD